MQGPVSLATGRSSAKFGVGRRLKGSFFSTNFLNSLGIAAGSNPPSKLSIDFINKIRVAPVAFGTTEHNRALRNTQKSRKHLASSKRGDDLAVTDSREFGLFLIAPPGPRDREYLGRAWWRATHDFGSPRSTGASAHASVSNLPHFARLEWRDGLLLRSSSDVLNTAS